jgi:hypothetical protein
MCKDVENWIVDCGRSIRGQTPTNAIAPLINACITTLELLELVCMDFFCLERSKGGFESVLVITGHFTKYSLVVPIRNQTETLHYGIPLKILSDQGANLKAKL